MRVLLVDLQFADMPRWRQRSQAVGCNSRHIGAATLVTLKLQLSSRHYHTMLDRVSKSARSVPSHKLTPIMIVTSQIFAGGHGACPLAKLPADATQLSAQGCNTYIDFTTHETPLMASQIVIWSAYKTKMSCRYHCGIRWAGNCSGGCRIMK